MYMRLFFWNQDTAFNFTFWHFLLIPVLVYDFITLVIKIVTLYCANVEFIIEGFVFINALVHLDICLHKNLFPQLTVKQYSLFVWVFSPSLAAARCCSFFSLISNSNSKKQAFERLILLLEKYTHTLSLSVLLRTYSTIHYLYYYDITYSACRFSVRDKDLFFFFLIWERERENTI